jgi:hypothetical protein
MALLVLLDRTEGFHQIPYLAHLIRHVKYTLLASTSGSKTRANIKAYWSRAPNIAYHNLKYHPKIIHSPGGMATATDDKCLVCAKDCNDVVCELCGAVPCCSDECEAAELCVTFVHGQDFTN